MSLSFTMAKSKTRVGEVAFGTLGVLLWRTNLTKDKKVMYVCARVRFMCVSGMAITAKYGYSSHG